jgi:OFA family oxalate/formate antiporter-like MFS transporter
MKMLIAGTVLMFFLGILYIWSVFVMPVSDALNWDIDEVKLIPSFMVCFFALGILAGGKLQARLETSKITLLGGLLMAAGVFVTAFIPAEIARLIYISYGIVGGLGVGIAYCMIISSVQKWFPKNRGFANGICVCAFGFSAVVFAPLTEWLIRFFGLQQAFLILSGAFFIATLSLFRFINEPDEAVAVNPAISGQPAQKQYVLKEVLVTREFYFITLSIMFLGASYLTLNPAFKTLAAERGLDSAMGTTLVMITGVANALGRLAVPLLSDKIGRNNGALFILSLTSLCAMALCFAESVPFIIAISLIAFCFGGSAGIYPVITADYFGVKNVGANHGAVMVGYALSALFFPMLIRLTTTGIWKFVVLAALAFLGAFLILLLKKTKSKERI